jgi:hypothetical protein
MTPEPLGDFTCATCGLIRMRTQTKRIQGAPDLLRIGVNNSEVRKKEYVRNNNYIKFNPIPSSTNGHHTAEVQMEERLVP